MASTFEFKDIVLPASLYQQVRSLKQYKTNSTRIEPMGNSASIRSSSNVEFSLPVGQGLLDIPSFAAFFKSMSLVGTAPELPAFGDSFVETLEVIINGQSVQTINLYNVLANINRNLTETTDHAVSTATYNGMQNAYVTYTGAGTANDPYINAGWENVISQWLGLLGCRKCIDASEDSGITSFRIKLKMASNDILAAGAANPTYTIGSTWATINTIQFSSPDLAKAVHELNGTSEIAYDYYNTYPQAVAVGGKLSLRLPTNVNCLNKIILTARADTFATTAATFTSHRIYDSSNYFKFNGIGLQDLVIQTGFGNFPSNPLATSTEQAYFTYQSLDMDDNYLSGGIGNIPIAIADIIVSGTITANDSILNNAGGLITGGAKVKDTAVAKNATLALDLYKQYGYAVVFGFNHRDASQSMLMGYNTKGISDFVINGTNNGTGNIACNVDAFSVASAILTLKPNSVSFMV